MATPSTRSGLQCFVHLASSDDDNNKDDTSKIGCVDIIEDGLNLEVQRPQSATSPKRFGPFDGITHTKEGSTMNNHRLRIQLKNSVTMSIQNGNDFVIWTFGPRGSGKTSLLFGREKDKDCSDEGENCVIDQISKLIAEICFSNPNHPFPSSLDTSVDGNKNDSVRKEESENAEFVVSASFLCVTGDETDRLFDCLSSDSRNSATTLQRLRERSDGTFFVPDLHDIIVQSMDELQFLLRHGLSTIREKQMEFHHRLHSLFTITLRTIFPNGDSLVSRIHIMDICGADRPANKPAKTTKTAARKVPRPKPREDKTLKALHRIIDHLHDKKSHIPYRDSKLTRLVRSGFDTKSLAHSGVASLCLLCLPFPDDAAFEEIAAMLGFATKVKNVVFKRIASEPPDKEPGSFIHRFNRQKEFQLAKDEAIKLAKTCVGMEGKDIDTLLSTDIQLDMNSSEDLVALRNALSKAEQLSTDPLEELRLQSREWWTDKDTTSFH